jgi:hypothetical protein
VYELESEASFEGKAEMSVSEQEVKSQIAEMREGLQSARASARTGRIVGILGVLVGLGIVAIYVALFISLGKSVVESKEIPSIVQSRFERLQLDSVISQVIQQAGPAYVKESQELLKDLDLQKVASEQLQALMEDLRPTLEREMERVRPRVEKMLLAQRDKTVAEVESMLEQKLVGRLREIVGQQGSRIATESGLDEETLQQMVANLQEASVLAFKDMLVKRQGDLDDELRRMQKLLEEVPELEDASERDIQKELGLVLIALLKHNLPDYIFEPGAFESAVRRRPAPAQPQPLPPEARKAREEARKAAQAAAAAAAAKAEEDLPPEARKAREEALKKAREAAAEGARQRAAAQGGREAEREAALEEARKAAEAAAAKARAEHAAQEGE